MGRRLAALAVLCGAGLMLALAVITPAKASPPSLSVVSASVSVTGPALNWNVSAVCPAGKQASGGGYDINPGGITNFSMLASKPLTADNGWSVGLDYYGSTSFTLTAYAVCFG